MERKLRIITKLSSKGVRNQKTKRQGDGLTKKGGDEVTISPIPDSQLPTPHRKAVRFVLAFRLGLGLLLLFSLFLGGCSNSSGLAWQTSQSVGWRVVPLLEQAVEENTQLQLRDVLERVRLVSIPLENQKTLWLIDYNVVDLCGTQGCLYSIYLEEDKVYKAVFSGYFQAELPEKYLLFQVSDRAQFNLPCLEVLQIQQQNQLQLTYCFNGKTYQLSEKLLREARE